CPIADKFLSRTVVDLRHELLPLTVQFHGAASSSAHRITRPRPRGGEHAPMIPPIKAGRKAASNCAPTGRGHDLWYASLLTQLPSFGPGEAAASNVVPLAKR